jgi:hypothetical protein
MINSASLGMIIGGEVGLFFAGVIYLMKGKARLSQTKIVEGPRVRLGALICVIPLPLTFLIAALTVSQQQDSLFVYFISLLLGTTGILVAVIGFVLGMALIYTSPESA